MISVINLRMYFPVVTGIRSLFSPSKGKYVKAVDSVSFDIEDDISNICVCLINNNFRRVTILHEGKLAGIITRADLIKAYLHRFKPKDTAEDSAGSNDGLRAKDVMRSGLLTVHKDTSIYEAMEIVATKNVTGLPVVDDSMNLLGIVSEKDMLKLLRESQVEPRTVQEYMTGDVISFNQESSLFDICDCLINNNFRRVPILNRGKLVGIISRTDIILYILKNKSTIFKYRRPS